MVTTQYGGDIIFMAKVLLVHGSDMLLLRRSGTDPRRPLTWDFPGGLVDAGEAPADTAVREVMEESGIKISDPEILEVFYESSDDTFGDKPVLSLIYTAECDNKDVKLSIEHDKYEWVDQAKSKEFEMPPKYHESIDKLSSQRS